MNLDSLYKYTNGLTHLQRPLTVTSFFLNFLNQSRTTVFAQTSSFQEGVAEEVAGFEWQLEKVVTAETGNGRTFKHNQKRQLYVYCVGAEGWRTGGVRGVMSVFVSWMENHQSDKYFSLF